MKLLGAFICLLFISCSGVSVKSDYDQGYNFKKLESFAWLQQADDSDGAKTSLIRKRIHKNVESILASKGYEKSGKDKSDFLIDYSYRSKEVMVPAAVQPSMAFGFGPRYYGSGFGLGLGYYGGGYQRREVETLSLDIWDAKTKEHVWSAAVETELAGDNAQETEENFSKAISAMLEDFPPDAKKD